MPQVVFTYFNVKGLGQSARTLLAYGGQEFEDRRVEKDKDWPALKPNTPFGQLPVLEIDGKQYAQSEAICRYLGRKYKLAGNTLEEDLEVDMIVAFFNDIRLKIVGAVYETDEKVKARKTEENKVNVPPMLQKLHDTIVKNKGYLALGKLTWADFYLVGVYDGIKFMTSSYIPDMDSKYPAFKKLQDTVDNLPKVKEFIAQCPKTTTHVV